MPRIESTKCSTFNQYIYRVQKTYRVFIQYCVFSKKLKYIPDSGLSRVSLVGHRDCPPLITTALQMYGYLILSELFYLGKLRWIISVTGFPIKDARLLKYLKSIFSILFPFLTSLSRFGLFSILQPGVFYGKPCIILSFGLKFCADEIYISYINYKTLNLFVTHPNLSFRVGWLSNY